MTETKNDRRIRKTRSALKNALISLLYQKPLNKITVKELTEICDINRATFYLHYRDVFDMLEQLEKEFFVDVEQILKKYASGGEITLEDMLTEIYTYIAAEENKAFAAMIICKYANSTFITRFADLFKKSCIFDWEALPPQLRESGSLAYSFIVNGAVGLIRTWIQLDDAPAPGEAARLTAMLCMEGMKIVSSYS